MREDVAVRVSKEPRPSGMTDYERAFELLSAIDDKATAEAILDEALGYMVRSAYEHTRRLQMLASDMILAGDGLGFAASQKYRDWTDPDSPVYDAIDPSDFRQSASRDTTNN